MEDGVVLSGNLLYSIAAISLLPFLLISTTSFIKLAVVLSLVRNALGIQQIPPNIVIYSLALLITAYIMFPLGVEVGSLLQEGVDADTDILTNLQNALVPVSAFLEQHTDPSQLQFFSQNIDSFWRGKVDVSPSVEKFFALLPAFVITELSEAFKIGFLIYLPFIAIDLVVSNILLSMGMMMVSPVTISLPFKLFLFVAVDGWSRLIKGLVMTYAGGA